MTKEKTVDKSKENITDFLLDDVKKRFGRVWEYIDEKVSGIYETIADVEKQSMSSDGAVIKDVNDLREGLSNTSDSAFNAINMCKAISVDLKRLMPLIDSLKGVKDEIDGLRKEYVSNFGEIEKVLDKEAKRMSDFFTSFGISVGSLSEKQFEFDATFKEHLRTFNEMRSRFVDMTKDASLVNGSISQNKEDISGILTELKKNTTKFDDVNRLLNNNHVLVVTDLGILRGEVKTLASKSELDELSKKVKLVDERASKPVVVTSSAKEEFNSSWKEQIEMKLSRIERKLKD